MDNKQNSDHLSQNKKNIEYFLNNKKTTRHHSHKKTDPLAKTYYYSVNKKNDDDL